MDNQMQLMHLTEKLLNYTETLEEKYAEVRQFGKGGDFYNEVKPFADEVKHINDKWKKEAIEWIREHSPKNLYPEQIESVYEHIETISVQAFYPETSRSRFINLVNSSKYVLNNLFKLLKE